MSLVKKLGQYKNIEVTVEKKVVSEEELEQQMQYIVSQNPKFVEKAGPVENGDVTTIDYEGFKDGVAFDGGTAQGHRLTIGSGQFIPGFEDQMIGMEKGETRELNLTFPSDYGVEELAGAAVVFKVTVHQIEKQEAAVLDDEFVKGFNIPNVNTVSEMKETLRMQMQAQHDQTYRNEVENAIFAVLVKDSEIEVDDQDIDVAMEEHINHLRMQLASQGIQLEQYLQMMGVDETALREQLKPSAIEQAKFEAIIDEIVKVENLNTTDEEVDQQVEAIASSNQLSKEEVLEKINAEDLKRDYNRVKASQLVIQSAIIHE